MKRKLQLLFAVLVMLPAMAMTQDLSLGLIAHYPFTGNALDSSGNNNNGTVYGATLTTGLLGIPNTAYHFDGANNYIEVPDSPSLTPTLLTMCAVVKPEGFYSGTCQGNVIFWKGNYATPGLYGLTFSDQPYDGNNCNNLDTLHETFYGNISTNNTGLSYTSYITSNTWYCLICTFDGATTKLYVDGTLRLTAPSTTPLGSNTLPLEIGRQNDVTFPYWFNGVIDEIRIYNRVLDSTEINMYCSLVNSVAEQNPSHSFDIYPNPATSEFTVESGEFNVERIEMWNVVGERLTPALSKGEGVRVDVSELPSGIYFVAVTDEKGNRAVRKVVKM